MAIGFGRVSIFCRDMAGSLAFYRDRLGLAVVEDKTIEGAAAGALLQLPPCRMRIVLLAPEADASVMLGLFEIGGLPEAAARDCLARVAYKMPFKCRFVTRRPNV